MAAKKKNRSASTVVKHKSKSSRPKPRKRTAKKAKPDIASLAVLNADKLKELYATMMKCRVLAERVQNAEISSKKSQHSISGFEAVLAGAGAHLLPHDCIVMEYGSFAASLIKGTPLARILAQTHRPSDGNTNNNKSVALSMSAVSSLAQKLTGRHAVILMFCPRSSGRLVFDSAVMADAATKKLPLVCLVESSFESRVESNHPSSSGPYVAVDSTFYPVIPVDGCDAVGVFRVAQEAIRRAREGHGPSVIECLTSRSAGLANAAADGSHTRHIAHDPLSFMEQYLRKRDLWSEKWTQSIVDAFKRDLDAALNSPFEQSLSNDDFDNVYSAEA